MNVRVPKEYEPFVRDSIASGRYRSEAALARAAFKLLDQMEQLRAAVDEGIADLKSGNYTDYNFAKPEDQEQFLKDIEAGSKARRVRKRKKA